MIELPSAFALRMKKMLGEVDYQKLLAAYDAPKYKGLRANTLKCTPDFMRGHLPFDAEPVSWCPTGFYIDPDEHPGKNPGYYAGLYYVQEPTAMTPAQALDAKPGDRVLDLCAAPGGKTTQIACALQGQGLLVANEVVNHRAGILAENTERMGVTNALLTNAFPEYLVAPFRGFFDKILVDAPCSGEGMFRKDPGAMTVWCEETPVRCAARQKKILESVDRMLKPGGVLVYSTCTFAPEENEQIVEALLTTGRYETQKIALSGIPGTGNPQWSLHGCEAVRDTLRVMPYEVKGEGHYVARLLKIDDADDWDDSHGKYKKSNRSPWTKVTKKQLAIYKAFADDFFCALSADRSALTANNSCVEGDQGGSVGEAFALWSPQRSTLVTVGDKLVALPEGVDLRLLDIVKVLRVGVHLGDFKTNRFEPSHTLAMALKATQVNRVYETVDDDEANRYLKGEVLEASGIPTGWTLVCWHGHPLGLGKVGGGVMKNHYPKGLRIRKK